MKLIAAASKAKKDLSPFGVNHSSVSVECLMEDRDFSTKFVRGCCVCPRCWVEEQHGSQCGNYVYVLHFRPWINLTS